MEANEAKEGTEAKEGIEAIEAKNPIAASAYRPIQEAAPPPPQWWGYSKRDGWVVLDRAIPVNIPGSKQPLLFMRCKDMSTFILKREEWHSPALTYAPIYLRGLSQLESGGATETLGAFQARWPEFEQEIKKQYEASLPPPEPEAPPKKTRKKAVKAEAVPEAAETAESAETAEPKG